MIAVVDYGAGNLRSIRRALEAAGAEVVVTDDPATVSQAEAVVLPGVGAARHAIETLDRMGMSPVIKQAAADGKPLLGICLGMQILFGHQEEGDAQGLGLLPGRVRRLTGPVKVPHIGWNRSRVVRDGPLGKAGEERYYYFVHSYVAFPDDESDGAAIAEYGEMFPSIVVRNNIWATQFHPEKSSEDGLALVRAFVAAAGERRRDTALASASTSSASGEGVAR
jgi:glutamine amidotransferase